MQRGSCTHKVNFNKIWASHPYPHTTEGSFTSSTAALTCTSEVVSDEVCTTLLERVGNLTIESEMCIVVYTGV
jgi:hypothetical protein